MDYENNVKKLPWKKTELYYFMFMVIRPEDFALGTRSASPSEYNLCSVAFCIQNFICVLMAYFTVL